MKWLLSGLRLAKSSSENPNKQGSSDWITELSMKNREGEIFQKGKMAVLDL